MHNLNLIEDKGWELETDKKLEKCKKCGGELELPFSFCPEFEEAFCHECEYITSRRLCRNFKDNKHEHFNVIELKEKK